MRKLLNIKMLIVFSMVMQIQSVSATVIEFNNDGSTTIYKSLDYIQKKRHQKHPYTAKSFNYTPPKEVNSYDSIILKYSKKYNVDPLLIKAVIAVESSYNPKIVSHAGARGLMQLMPDTARRFNVSNSFDPDQNIRGGTKYLRFLHKRFNGDIKLILAGYNAGEGAVQKYNGVPPYKETIKYIPKVLKAYKKLK